MKEKLYEIPLNDAIDANDECPFCFVERKTEQDCMDFVLGSCASYMESDTREATDQAGFCRMHQKKMFDYGNALGNGWILKTYYKKLIKEMEAEVKGYAPASVSLKERLTAKVKPAGRSASGRQISGRSGEAGKASNPIAAWVEKKEGTCYICDRFAEVYGRYIAAFFYLYKSDAAFREKVKAGKGFCLHHFGDLCEGADRYLNDAERKEFFPMISEVMIRNMKRMSEDVDWFIEKFDYQNQDADWKQSKDAIQRGMQKIRGGYPADPVYRMR